MRGWENWPAGLSLRPNLNYRGAVEANSLTRFAQACGAVRPLDLLVERPNGSIAKSTSIPQPFAVVGSDPYCDLPLPGSGLAPRHLSLQVIQGRLFAVDISGMPNGLMIVGVPRGDGWIAEGEAVVMAGHRLYLTAPVAPPLPSPTSGFHPLVPNAEIVGRLVKSQLEFRNGRTAQSKWDVNRVLTLVGRAKACKINLTSEDVSLYHCSLLLTADGLWVIDLFGRGGLTVNGLPQRFFRLAAQDQLTVARFHLGVAYPNGDPGEPIVPLAQATPISHHDLFDSHFVSPNPLRTGASETPPPTAGQATTPEPGTPSPRVEMPKDLVVPGMPADGTGAITAPMFEQFQQSMLLMMKMFGQMHQQQMAGLQQEMARLATLTEEIGKMQSDIQKAVAPAPAALPHYNPLPAPEEVAPMSESTAEQHQQIFDKMAKLEAERQSIWKRLSNAFGPKPVTA